MSGLTVTPDQVGDMAKAMTLIDPASRGQVHAALRSLAITEPDERPPFDGVFARFFEGFAWSGPSVEPSPRIASMSAVKPVLQSLGQATAEDVDTRTGASTVESIQTRDFADLDDDDLAEARRLVLSMFWQPSDVKTRRWVASSVGSQPDLRRTLRETVRPDGDLIPIAHRRRRIRQRPLIIIADISGSMEKYAEMFLVFAHAAQRRIDQVEVFTFSTSLTRITTELKRRDVQSALSLVGESVHDWSGGTMIGEAISQWNRSWSRRMSRGRPVVLILSDGWDCGDPEMLAREMARLSRTVSSVLWLNPLASRTNYQPATRGMRTALPYVDHLLPAASVHDLRGVVRLLDSMNR
jgi:uncharacterized protein with von Willebrand factor type A (vWA) domain